MAKISFIGAGSTVFAKNLLRDILHFPELAAIIQTNVNVQSLTVEAALTGKKEHIYQAAMLDPHTGAELSLD